MKKILFVLLVLLAPLTGYTQRSIEFTGCIGYTAVDIEGIVEIDESEHTSAEDWGNLNGGVSGQLFAFSYSFIGFGFEAMYQYLYWYSVRVPYGATPIYRDYTINAFKIAPIVRFGVNSFVSADIGPTLSFMDGARAGAFLSANLNFKVSDRIYIPIKVRGEIINYIKVVAPISLNAGIRIKI